MICFVLREVGFLLFFFQQFDFEVGNIPSFPFNLLDANEIALSWVYFYAKDLKKNNQEDLCNNVDF